MHYFTRNIGDYHKKAGRLSILQHGAYTLLLDACYDRERFPTLEEAIDWTWAHSAEERKAVEFVLRKFFILKDGLYVQDRIREEIEAYRQKGITNKRIAVEREERRRAEKHASSTTRAQGVNDSSPNQEPITNNHKPITSNQLDYSCWPQQPAQQTLDDWLAMRKRLKANVSQTVINRFASELKKAVQFGYSVDFCLQECVTRNWRGFEVQWLLNSGVSHAQSKRFTQPSDNRDKAARAADEAFGISERGVFEGDFTRADPYGLIEQPERGAVQDLDEGAL